MRVIVTSDHDNSPVRSVILVLVAAVLFGTTGTSQALGPETTTPLSVGAVRIGLGGTLLAIVAFMISGARRRRWDATATRRRVDKRSALLMLATGTCLWLYQPLFFFGTERNGVAVGTIVALGSTPIIAGLVEWTITRKRPSLIWVGATALATVGVAFLALGGGATAAVDPMGILASLAAAGTFAVIANAQRRLLDDGWDPFTVVGSMGAIAAVPAIITLPFVDLQWLGTGQGITVALWLAIMTIVLAYAMFTWGLAGLTAATAATLTLGEPLTAAILGVTVLQEVLSPLAIAGLIVLAVGLVLLAWGSRKGRDPVPFAVEA
jgi:DME family drug/metabolite transporter